MAREAAGMSAAERAGMRQENKGPAANLAGSAGGLNPLAILLPFLGGGGGAATGLSKWLPLAGIAAGAIGGGLGNRGGGNPGRMGGGNVMPWPGQYYRQGNVQWQAPAFSPAPSPGFANFLGALYGRYGQPSAAYQGYLQALQERRDARMGVPNVPPQGAASPSAQRAIPSALAGGRSY